MRIVSGKFGGIRLTPVKSDKTRPTIDKVKESLFSMVGPYFEDGWFLDLFAGSGAVGIEAVSRGMAHAVLVDRQFQAIKAIKENIEKIHAEDQFDVIKGSAERVLAELAEKGDQFNVVYLDPPYRLQKIVATLDKLVSFKLLVDQALVICETDNHTELPANPPHFRVVNRKNYGLTNLTIYRYQMEDE